jgi:hypothetical protein
LIGEKSDLLQLTRNKGSSTYRARPSPVGTIPAEKKEKIQQPVYDMASTGLWAEVAWRF